MPTTVQEVPLAPAQPQHVQVALAGTGYQLTFKWCAPASCWMMTVMDQNGNVMAAGIPLVTGSGLLQQLAYLGIEGELLVQSDNDANAVPTFDNLGVLGHLYYVQPGE